MGQQGIQFYREHGYSYLGTDGETWLFIRGGFAYIYHDDLGFFPAAKLDCPYSVAHHPEGADHMTALEMMAVERRYVGDYYAELMDVELYPNQRYAWTLPPEQEC
jgi:hypothetical protein